MVIDENVCKTCGVCSESKCPFKAVKPHNEVVYQIYVGGTWGKKSRMGTPLSKFVSEDEIAPILEKTMIWFKLNANPKERLGVAIDRLGVEKFEKDDKDKLLSCGNINNIRGMLDVLAENSLRIDINNTSCKLAVIIKKMHI